MLNYLIFLIIYFFAIPFFQLFKYFPISNYLIFPLFNFFYYYGSWRDALAERVYFLVLVSMVSHILGKKTKKRLFSL